MKVNSHCIPTVPTVLTMLPTVLSAEQKGAHGTATDVEHITITGACASIGLTQREVIEVQAQLTDLLAHQLHLQLATRKIARHKAGKLRRYNVGEIVGNGPVAGGHKDATDTESHGAFTLCLPTLLPAFVGIETVAQAASIIRQTFTIHGHWKQMNHCKQEEEEERK